MFGMMDMRTEEEVSGATTTYRVQLNSESRKHLRRLRNFSDDSDDPGKRDQAQSSIQWLAANEPVFSQKILVVIAHYQTVEEFGNHTSHVTNGVGFSQSDAPRGTDLAGPLCSWLFHGCLTHLEGVRKNRREITSIAIKYAGSQIVEILQANRCHLADFVRNNCVDNSSWEQYQVDYKSHDEDVAEFASEHKSPFKQIRRKSSSSSSSVLRITNSVQKRRRDDDDSSSSSDEDEWDPRALVMASPHKAVVQKSDNDESDSDSESGHYHQSSSSAIKGAKRRKVAPESESSSDDSDEDTMATTPRFGGSSSSVKLIRRPSTDSKKPVAKRILQDSSSDSNSDSESPNEFECF